MPSAEGGGMEIAMREEMDGVFWGQIHGARSLIDTVLEAVAGNKGVILCLPEQVPWYHTMRKQIEGRVEKTNWNHALVSVDGADEESIRSPGKYLMQQYCSREKQRNYRPNRGYAEFLADNKDVVFHTKFIWVRNIKESRIKAWIDFVVDYNVHMKTCPQRAIILLEVSGYLVNYNPHGVKVVSLENEVSEYDSVTFNMLMASGSGINRRLMPYLTELTSKIAKLDVELSAECIEKGKAFLKSPKLVLNEIENEKKRSDGSDYHYLGTEEDILRAVWETQIKLIFPVIESFRSDFVRKYKVQIEKELPLTADYGEEYNEAGDVEIGILYFMARSKKIYVEERDLVNLTFFREMRNRLAHIKTLSFEELERVSLM